MAPDVWQRVQLGMEVPQALRYSLLVKTSPRLLVWAWLCPQGSPSGQVLIKLRVRVDEASARLWTQGARVMGGSIK